MHELGLMFNDTGRPLQKLLDSGSKFVDEASAHAERALDEFQRLDGCDVEAARALVLRARIAGDSLDRRIDEIIGQNVGGTDGPTVELIRGLERVNMTF